MTDPTTSIHPDTTLGAVHLTVAALDRSIEFYQQTLGFQLLDRYENSVSLGPPGAGRGFLALTEAPSAPKVSRSTGLYHFAILVPGRRELALALRRLLVKRRQPQGFADHGVSEAIYLADPDDNGIEIYRDRPRTEWPFQNGSLQMVSERLDLEGLMDEIRSETGGSAEEPYALAPGTILGHIHLRVASIPAAESFYTKVLGFDLIQNYGSSASFVSAGGYHHHIGFNTWESAGAPPPPPGALGLRSFTIRLPDRQSLSAVVERIRSAGLPLEETSEGLLVRDPSQNTIILTA